MEKRYALLVPFISVIELNMVQPKNEAEDLLSSMTKNCETHIKQTHTKPLEAVESRFT